MDSRGNANLVWVDLEMTGLDPFTDHILEMAFVVTTSNLRILGKPVELVIHQPDSVLDTMSDWCKEHHGRSGLTAACQKSRISLTEARERVMDYVRECADEGLSPLCGSSVWTDKFFLMRFMPELFEFLHYRILDVSSIKEAVLRYLPEHAADFSGDGHRALEDITRSIEELDHYRKQVFARTPLPPPRSGKRSDIPSPSYGLRIHHVLAVYFGYDRDAFAFVHAVCDDRFTEYRFQGILGFGGKFWINNGKWYVSCYPEDETPERSALIERANEELAALFGEYQKEVSRG